MQDSPHNATPFTTTDIQARTGRGKYYGITLRGAGGAVVASVYDGTSASGKLIDTIAAADAGSNSSRFPLGVKVKDGIFVDAPAANGVGVVYHN